MGNVCELQIEVTWTGRDTALIALSGDLDFTTASRVTTASDMLHDRRVARLVVDMSAVGFCDSSGMAALVALWRIVHRQGGVMSLTGVDPALAQRLSRFRLTKLFEIDPAACRTID